MILYHGSYVEVKEPIIIRKNDRGRDFGYAFYLTPIKEQAERMAKRKQKQENAPKAIVSVFDWNEDTTTYKYKKFKNPDLEWLDMIVNCRSKPNYNHGFDIMEGRIADDTVGETILFVLEKVITKEDAIERLKYQKINSQIAFCSEASLKSLKFVKSYEVN